MVTSAGHTFSQDVLDGIYIHPIIEFNKVDSLFQYEHNAIFRSVVKTNDHNFIDLDSNEVSNHFHYPKAQKLFKDCIFFDPIVFYSPMMERHELQDSYFFLKYHNHQKYHRSREQVFPNSLRFYIDSTDVFIDSNQKELNLKRSYAAPYNVFLEPFYFRKYEVTNAEYREFVDWVRDSIARTLISLNTSDAFLICNENGKCRLNWKLPIPWKEGDYKEALDELFIPDFGRFRNEDVIDKKKMNFRLIKPIAGYQSLEINVFPNENCWVEDFPYSFNEPMTNRYFQHPAYNEYPVVGVSYYQAKAYLQWRSMMDQKQLDQKNINFKIDYSLPTEAQWDMAATAEWKEKELRLFTSNYYELSDENWITDLQLKHPKSAIIDVESELSIESVCELKDWYNNSTNNKDFTKDGSFHTAAVSIEPNKNLNPLIALNKDANGICYMGGNVSEWIDASYVENWKALFDKRQQAFATYENEAISSISDIEKYLDKQNDPDGKLIRGGNWYDERFSSFYGKNVDGMKAKTFASPSKSFATVGFRYVIKIELKD